MFCLFFFFKQKTAYEMRISDWSSDGCSSDLAEADAAESNRSAALAPRPVDQHRDLGAPGGEQLQEAEGALPIGRASCRERVCQNVSIAVAAVSLKKKSRNTNTQQRVVYTH